ncbi:MAG: patatin family protein [Atopobiaceae bacterium]|nr:patatin family protein [Atopobiaceae bacterium]MCI2173581.1 patatin family protein [Atopobiaceae bacterium]MCI2207777.1 patatin family protein [Atopobiaceae bacterium]
MEGVDAGDVEGKTPLSDNVLDYALVLEGGGMRASYTAGLVNVLLEQGIHFGYACGISAGSSHVVDYVSRDADRVRRAFVDLAGNPNCGGMGSLMRHDGYFNADYDYAGCIADGFLPFDWETFRRDPARIRIASFERDTGRSVSWTKDDMPTQDDMVERVRASSTMPKLMVPIEIDGQVMLDGGLGKGAGLPTCLAEQDGFGKMFVITSREAGYRKQPLSHAAERMVRRMCKGYPHVLEAMLTRTDRYNAALDHLADLERSGAAYVVRPEVMPVRNTTLSVPELQRAYEMGHSQGMRELPRWREFLFGASTAGPQPTRDRIARAVAGTDERSAS